MAEKQRQEALVLAQKMRKERDVALQKAIAANERLKDGVGSCLSLSMEQTTEQARLHLAMEDLEGRVHSKECRDRIGEALVSEGDSRVSRATKRRNEYCAAQGLPARQEEGGGGSRCVDDALAGVSVCEEAHMGAPEEPVPVFEEARMGTEPDDVDDLMDDTVGMLERAGVKCKDKHREANALRKVLLTCGGDKALVRAKIIEIYSPPRVTAAARRCPDINIEGWYIL